VYARIKAADASAEASLAQYEQTVLNAWKKPKTLWLTTTRSAPASITRLRRPSQRKADELAHLRFEEGVSDFLTVLDTNCACCKTRIGWH